MNDKVKIWFAVYFIAAVCIGIGVALFLSTWGYWR